MYISLFFLIFFYKKEFLILIFQLNINYNLFKIIHKKNEKDYIHFACLIFSTNIYIYFSSSNQIKFSQNSRFRDKKQSYSILLYCFQVEEELSGQDLSIK